MRLASTFFSAARYSALKAGNTVTIRRTLDDRTPGPLCTPAFNAEYRAALKKVLANLKAQLVYGTAE